MKVRVSEKVPASGFDVTTVIGRVEFGEGELAPHEAAFLLIANYDNEGTFKFPMPAGGTCAVTVAWEDMPNGRMGGNAPEAVRDMD